MSVVFTAIDGRDVGVIIGILCGALGGLTGFTWMIFRIAKGIAGDVAQINRAVNHQPDTEPKLIDRIKQLTVSAEQLKQAADKHDGEIATGLSKLEDGYTRLYAAVADLTKRMKNVEAAQTTAADVATERDDRNEQRTA